MNKKIYSTILSILCLGILSFAAVTVANAQGRYANVYPKGQVSGTINKLEQSSNTFRRDFDRQMDQSNLNGTREEDRLNGIVQNYEESLNRLRGNFDRNDNWWDSRSDVQDVMNNARPVNVMMNSLGFARRLERQWNRMRQDLNKLADTYDLPDLAGGGWTGGPGGGGPIGGGNMGNAPAWAQGTWYWMNGQDRQMTIARNGQVTLYTAGRTSYGTYYRGNITLDGNVSSITRAGNNIRTYNTSTGETSDYSRTNSGGGYNPPGGRTSRPPSWAQGTWFWANGNDRTLTIAGDGQVTLYTGGIRSYGTYNNGTIMLDGNLSTVTRNRNNIRTYNQSTGETSDYVRRR